MTWGRRCGRGRRSRDITARNDAFPLGETSSGDIESIDVADDFIQHHVDGCFVLCDGHRSLVVSAHEFIHGNGECIFTLADILEDHHASGVNHSAEGLGTNHLDGSAGGSLTTVQSHVDGNGGNHVFVNGVGPKDVGHARTIARGRRSRRSRRIRRRRSAAAFA